VSPHVNLCTLKADQHDRVAALLHRSLVSWYENHLKQGHRFGTSPSAFCIFPKLYEALDPGEALCVTDDEGEIRGVCFVHTRDTHVSIGIVATDPQFSGKGIARLMMEAAIARGIEQDKPVRLVSSLMNLDSFSLYTRLGFMPGAVFQDIEIHVPDMGLCHAAPAGVEQIRLATHADVEQLAELEFRLQRIRRAKDYAFFLNNTVGDWQIWIYEDDSCEMRGFMVSSQHPDWNMIGPGIAFDSEIAQALIWKAINERRNRSTVLLAPACAKDLIATLYKWGGKNIELHIAQSTVRFESTSGIVFPTFLPETG
jgi:ribosomal protein S18 acetylase RimI-like enzyme